jgi:hypothetical protein
MSCLTAPDGQLGEKVRPELAQLIQPKRLLLQQLAAQQFVSEVRLLSIDPMAAFGMQTLTEMTRFHPKAKKQFFGAVCLK